MWIKEETEKWLGRGKINIGDGFDLTTPYERPKS
jgi:hypothetical protein